MIPDIWKKVGVIIDEFGSDGVFRSNSGTSLILRDNAIYYAAKLAYMRSDMHPVSAAVMDLVDEYYQRAISYRKVAP